jgi:peptidoglycan/LPS O-acetylase OafA/YrhL
MYKAQLDGFRGMLFLAVFTYHHNVTLWILTYALPCFFVMSGFLITRILLRGDLQTQEGFMKAFYIRRAIRILPVFYVVTLACWFFGILLFPLSQFTYTFNIHLFWLSLDRDGSGFHEVFKNWDFGQMHLWSMCIEEQFYLLYPILLLKTKKSWRAQVLFLSIIASVALRLWFKVNHPELLCGALLPICGEYILWGCLASVLTEKGLRFGPASAWLYGGSALLLILAQSPAPHMETGFFQFIPGKMQTLFAIGIMATIVGLWFDDDSLLSRFLQLRPIAYMGKISYGLYLMHMAMFDLGDWLYEQYPTLSNFNDYTVRLILVLLFGTVSWYLLEAPINRLKKHFPMPYSS